MEAQFGVEHEIDSYRRLEILGADVGGRRYRGQDLQRVGDWCL
jgi:hypothetical protein